MTEPDPASERFRKAFVLILLLIVGATFLAMIRQFIIALALAGVFAALLYPFFRQIRHGLRGRPAPAALVVLTTAMLGLGLPMLAVLGAVATEAVYVSQQIQPWANELMSADTPVSFELPEWLPYRNELEPYKDEISGKIAEAASAAGQWLVSNVSAVTQGTLGFLLGLFVMLYAMFYFLIAGPRLLDACKAHLPLAVSDWELILDRGMAVTRASLKGIVVIGALQGLLLGLALWAAGIQGAVFWGTLMVILSAIPGVGAPLIWVPAAGYLFLIGETAWAVGMALWGLLVIGSVDNILRPVVVGHEAKLPDLVILVATLGGIVMFGAIGILLGPIIAAFLDTVLNIYRRAFSAWLPTEQ